MNCRVFTIVAIGGLLATGGAATPSVTTKTGVAPAHTEPPAKGAAPPPPLPRPPPRECRIASGKLATVTSPGTPTKSTSTNKPATPKVPPAKPATAKTVVKVKPVVGQKSLWVVKYATDSTSAVKRVPFSTLAAAERWLEEYKQKHPSAWGSISRKSSGRTCAVK